MTIPENKHLISAGINEDMILSIVLKRVSEHSICAGLNVISN